MATALSALQLKEDQGSLSAPYVVNGNIAGATGAEVLLLDENGSPLGRAFAGAGGSFEIRVQDVGQHRLAIRRNGKIQEIESLTITSAEPIVTVHAIEPRPFEERPKSGSDDPLVGVRRLARNVPKEARRLYDEGVRRRERGDPAGAVKRMQEAVRVAPDYLEPLNDLAVLYIRADDYGRAEGVLRRAISLDPTAWQPRLNLGVVLFHGAAYEAAREEMERAQHLAPRSPLPPFHLGRVYIMLGQSAEAEACFDRALELEAGFPQVRLFRGYARIQRGRLREGREDLAAFLKQAHGAAEAERALARLAEIDLWFPKILI